MSLKDFAIIAKLGE